MAPSLTSKRTSKRYSTYSASPSFATTTSNYSNAQTLVSGSGTANITVSPETGMAEIRHLTQGLDRLENKRLSQQRFVPSQKKSDDLSKLSLGAKVERALGRRMSDQDAVLRVKRPVAKKTSTFTVIDEKAALKI
ncbi:hypothetical protein AYO21_04392 [Fonsecaea monophora]|uniref:Uncharacterized protein n=2 Tax=Fonsecaea TaxID=40354 RepID=A0A0D2HHB8_9EURO|nr:uncharacterized protein Z517_03095 [Fonsecaea pedrosoi CBS 271.37]XP_022513402.1 hypothetical protein AYO21_04392 [Fonsecaea monophora]KAH0848366.1 hypothetical protein FOPE_02418 [Fonsecaea pedrosoi]KIW83849.1 hypothetical protein Z517_03095 [Fonsecaea pedrosoi CBS 271.37]OAG41450.1 hypothetical protein AYO21_04392 [Fonsecaea monophora]